MHWYLRHEKRRKSRLHRRRLQLRRLVNAVMRRPKRRHGRHPQSQKRRFLKLNLPLHQTQLPLHPLTTGKPAARDGARGMCLRQRNVPKLNLIPWTSHLPQAQEQIHQAV